MINGKWKIENGKLNVFCVIVFVLIEVVTIYLTINENLAKDFLSEF